jgi:MEMO1 family protein
MASVHVSPYGGSWYPGQAGELERLLDELFERVERRAPCALSAPALGFVVPHAGLHFSGAVAASAYRALIHHPPRRIVILGFAHSGGPAGVSIPNVEAYATPLGQVPIDHDTVCKLAGHAPFRFVDEYEICDHSVEIQLPFLQRAAPGVPVVPLFVGHMDDYQRDAAARILAGLIEPETAFLVSSDFTHYGQAFGYQPFPADAAVAERLAHLDRGLIEAAGSLDAALFCAAVDEVSATVCGVEPIALWLRALGFFEGDEVFQETLDYQTSGEVTGDYHHTVSYAALGYFPAAAFSIGGEDQALLVESAQRTLCHLRATGEARPVPPPHVTPALTRRCGLFVSLHQGPRLLGCVGHHVAEESLAELAPRLTLRAALDDPRFPTVLGVTGEIDIEISILTPFKRIRSPATFRLHAHGAWIEAGRRQALLLPQVARDHSWTGPEFVRALAIKAGLAAQDAFAPPARISVFRAQVFPPLPRAAPLASSGSCAPGDWQS